MRLEHLTHYTDHDSKIHVFVKSFISHRRTKWVTFAKYFQGYSIRVEKFNRYSSPTDFLKGTPHYDTLEQNKFTIDMNDSLGAEARQVEQQAKGKKRKRVRSAVTSRLFGLGLEEGRILPSAGHPGVLAQTMIRFFKDGWTTGRCLELQVTPRAPRRPPRAPPLKGPPPQGYSLIETHRRVLKLEHFISGKEFPAEGLAALRAQAFSQRKYILADPTTLCLPLLLGHMRGGFDLQDNAAYRLRALATSIRGLVVYGSEITRLVREHLSGALLAGASDCLFDWPFTFLPDGLSSILSEGLPMTDSDQIITRRIEKEQVRARPIRPACGPGLKRARVAGRPPRAHPDQEDPVVQPARRHVRAHVRGRGRALGHRHLFGRVHAAPAPDPEHARGQLRPRGLPVAAPAPRRPGRGGPSRPGPSRPGPSVSAGRECPAPSVSAGPGVNARPRV